MNSVIQKLTDKGFNGADIHWFLMRFDIQIIIPIPLPIHGLICIHPDDTKEDIEQKVKELEDKQEAWRKAQLSINNKGWELANIAADFEIPR